MTFPARLNDTPACVHCITAKRCRPQELIVRAVDGESVNYLLTDPWQADNPIVYASPAFCRLTLFTLDEVVGRSCRFLQGEGTDFLTVRRMGAWQPRFVTLCC